MTTPRGSLVWLAMVVAGLSLGAYVLVAWPGSSSPAGPSPRPVRATASASHPETELAGVAGAFYPGTFYGYSFEAGTTPALDAVISAPLALGAG